VHVKYTHSQCFLVDSGQQLAIDIVYFLCNHCHYLMFWNQIYNFLRFCELLVITCSQLKTIHLTTGFDDVCYKVYIHQYIFRYFFAVDDLCLAN